jgi:hypothetical protein
MFSTAHAVCSDNTLQRQLLPLLAKQLCYFQCDYKSHPKNKTINSTSRIEAKLFRAFQDQFNKEAIRQLANFAYFGLLFYSAG